MLAQRGPRSGTDAWWPLVGFRVQGFGFGVLSFGVLGFGLVGFRLRASPTAMVTERLHSEKSTPLERRPCGCGS